MESQSIRDYLVNLARNSRSSFALVHRAGCASGSDFVELLEGHVSSVDNLSALNTDFRALALLPFRAAAELGYECHEDDARILVLTVESCQQLPLAAFACQMAKRIEFQSPFEFSLNDEEFAALVETVQSREIGQGECSNVVLSRTLIGKIGGDVGCACLQLFENLLATEIGYYWAFLVKAGDCFFVGASPERHVSLNQGSASMTAISGTVRRSDTTEQYLQLASAKQQFELSMVVDEEIKMLSPCCEEGVRVRGPLQRVMSKVIHSEFEVAGHTNLNSAALLTKTIFAPTVVGSPLANAFRVIKRNETSARGYYSGVVALIDPASAEDSLDSAILIRTAEIRSDGNIEFRVGATITKDSEGGDEASETWLKAQAFISATLGAPVAEKSFIQLPIAPQNIEEVPVSKFWSSDRRLAKSSALSGLDIVIVDGEDLFSRLWLEIIRSLGARANWYAWCDPDVESHVMSASVTVLGPGPGDPRKLDSPRQQKLWELCNLVLNRKIPTIAICLSHQIMCQALGMRIRRRDTPNQGLQRMINWIGRPELVGYYNTFEVIAPKVGAAWQIEVNDDGSLDYLLADRLCSVQFHPESFLTRNGPDLIRDCVLSVVN